LECLLKYDSRKKTKTKKTNIIHTLQLHGLLLELTVPLLSHLELSAERGQWKEDNIWGEKCTWECSSHAAYLSHDHITVHCNKNLMVIFKQGQDLLMVTLQKQSSVHLLMPVTCICKIIVSADAEHGLTFRNTFSIWQEGVTLVTRSTPEFKQNKKM